MGGSGGGGFFSGRPDPEKLRDRLRKAEESAVDQTFETAVAEEVASVLGEVNQRDTGEIGTILEQVQADISEEVEGAVSLLFGGSVAKHTYVDGLSDVDALVLVKAENDESPAELKRRFVKRLVARYGRDAVSEGQLAVTVNLGGNSIQLLPASRSGSQLRISNAAGTDWARINPRRFADLLSKANKAMSGKLVPTIKLAKSVMSSLPEQRRLTGYHTEALATRIFENYGGPKVPKAMLQHFFERAPGLVLNRIRDQSGQSSYVDEYLGSPGSAKRRVTADALARIGRRLRNADGARSVQRWSELLRGEGE